jgi:hypothetical protein
MALLLAASLTALACTSNGTEPYDDPNPRDADQLWTATDEDLERSIGELDESEADAELERLEREIDGG